MELHKVIAVSASALLLLGIGASANTCTTNVSASRISRLEARRSRDYRDISNIDKQLSKLRHHTKRSRKHVARRSHHARKHENHESEAAYYKKYNDKKNGYLTNHSKAYRKGYNDAYTYTLPGQQIIRPSLARNRMYKRGWTYGYVNMADNDSTSTYAKALRHYRDGLNYLAMTHASYDIQLQSDNRWTKADD